MTPPTVVSGLRTEVQKVGRAYGVFCSVLAIPLFMPLMFYAIYLQFVVFGVTHPAVAGVSLVFHSAMALYHNDWMFAESV